MEVFAVGHCLEMLPFEYPLQMLFMPSVSEFMQNQI